MTASIPDLRGTGFIPKEEFFPPPTLSQTLTDEGFRLFFPLTALHAALWPFLWVAVQGYGLIGADAIPPGVWHMHEMIWGSFGAALIGFLTTAFPEWTDTPPLKGQALWIMAGLWGTARIVGLAGSDALNVIAGLADLAWLCVLIGYGAHISWLKRTDALLPFLGWLCAFWLAEAAARWHMWQGDGFEAAEAMRAGGLVFLGMMGLTLARITISVTNLVLDPSGETSPFRPHPGRLNLGPGLVALAVVGQAAGVSQAVGGWLLIAAGAAMLDRVGEGFIGPEGMRAEILGLSLPSALAGTGLVWIGTARIGATWAETGGWHLALMGGLGLATLSVMSIAGLFHAGRALPFGRPARAALLLVVLATALRLIPEVTALAPFALHLGATLLWAGAFAVWLWGYWPILSDPNSLGEHDGC
jgi:uncharacterized protein involved in response to NO